MFHIASEPRVGAGSIDAALSATSKHSNFEHYKEVPSVLATLPAPPPAAKPHRDRGSASEHRRIDCTAQGTARFRVFRLASMSTISELACAHQAQLSYDRRTTQASARELEEKISLSAAALQGLRESLRQAEADKLQAEAKGAELLRATARAEAELRDARAETGAAIEETRTEKEAREALQAELATLREKYSALKRRFVDAGKKVREACVPTLAWPAQRLGAAWGARKQ